MNSVTRTPPNNLEAETSVLGGILIDNQMYQKLEDVIEPEDFYRPANSKMFRAMRELAVRNEPVDTVTLTMKMKEMGVFEECGGAAFIADILERVPTAINAEYHAKLVADQAIKRRLVSACTELGQRGMEPGEITEELLDYAEQTIFGLTSSRKTKSILAIRDIVKPAFQELEYRFAHRGELTGIPSGFDGLDRQTNGFQRSDLIVIACRPSIGKTSFSLGLARHAATKKKLPVLFFSLEMSKEQIVTRLLAAEAKVDSTKIRSGDLADQDWSKLTRAAGILADAPLFIDDTAALTVLEMRAKARRLKSQQGDLGMIIVDYLQIMGTPKYSESREKAISEISRSLKALAKELNVPVIALSQLNRGIESRQEKRPMMSDIRESGAIEQDADVIIFIHRDNADQQGSLNASPATLIVGKNRNGPREDVQVTWLGQYTSFENMATVAQ